MEGDVEADTEVLDELLVGVGFCSAKVMIDVCGGEADAERVARDGVGGVKGEKEGDRVGTPGDGNRNAIPGFDVGVVEGESGLGRHPTPSY